MAGRIGLRLVAYLLEERIFQSRRTRLEPGQPSSAVQILRKGLRRRAEPDIGIAIGDQRAIFRLAPRMPDFQVIIDGDRC